MDRKKIDGKKKEHRWKEGKKIDGKKKKDRGKEDG